MYLRYAVHHPGNTNLILGTSPDQSLPEITPPGSESNLAGLAPQSVAPFDLANPLNLPECRIGRESYFPGPFDLRLLPQIRTLPLHTCGPRGERPPLRVARGQRSVYSRCLRVSR